jgi:aspartate kinase
MAKIKIGGVMQSEGRALLKILSVPDRPGVAGTLLSVLGQHGVNIEFLSEGSDIEGYGNFAIGIDQKDLDAALGILESVKNGIDARGITYVPDVAVLSVFGPHLREKPKVPAAMFNALAGNGINVIAISTSISSVSCVIEAAYLDAAIQALKDTFEIPFFDVKKRPRDY